MRCSAVAEINGFPDIELLVIGWMQSLFNVDEVRFVTDLPLNIDQTIVRVSAISGANRDIVVDRPIIDVDVFAADRTTASAAGRQIQAIFAGVRNLVTDNGVILRIDTITSPRWLPDINQELSRNSASYEPHTRL
jgi:hypothetical protein